MKKIIAAAQINVTNYSRAKTQGRNRQGVWVLKNTLPNNKL